MAPKNTIPHDMHPEDVKAAIRKRGRTLEQLSEHWGFDKSAIAVALKRPWPAVQELVATELQRSPAEIWPSRYNSEGAPVATKQSKAKSNESPVARNSELKTAA